MKGHFPKLSFIQRPLTPRCWSYQLSKIVKAEPDAYENIVDFLRFHSILRTAARSSMKKGRLLPILVTSPIQATLSEVHLDPSAWYMLRMVSKCAYEMLCTITTMMEG